MSVANEPSATIRARAIAREYNVSEATIYAWARNGVLPSVKVGKIRLFDRASCEAILRGREKRSHA